VVGSVDASAASQTELVEVDDDVPLKLSDLRAERFLAPPCELASSSFGATMPEGTARAVQPEGTSVVPIEPPPVYSLALAWRRDDGSPLLRRFLEFMGAYRDEHGWTGDRARARLA
jgi:hypothetical protein